MEIALPAQAGARPRRRYSFLEKIALAGALVALADWLFFFQRGGSTLGLFALALLASAALASPGLRRDRKALAALGAAAAFALALADDPSPLAAALCWASASLAVLLPSSARFGDSRAWAKRLAAHALFAPIAPVVDAARLRRTRGRSGGAGLMRRLPVLILPVAGSLVFILLFAVANPLIGDALGRLDLLAAFGGLSIARIGFWIAATILVWALLRPRFLRLAPPRPSEAPLPLPGVSVASVTLSLLAFNAIFALQNGLDLAFLWSGAPLPEGMTLADYAHRGAYPLIGTALLAGLFVLVTLRPGSATAASAPLRRLVYAWIAQNVLLVASTMLRTLDYIEAYSLTRLRIAALIWMALVAVGLILICYRLWRDRSGTWLVNANVAAAALVLAACSVIDLGAVAAQWNVRHAREAGGRGAALDLCYLNRLGPSALLPLVELESRPLDPAFRERVSWARNVLLDRLATDQGDWRGWTFRNHRRLQAARALAAQHKLPRFTAGRRSCGGYELLPPAPLTAGISE